MRRRGGKYSIAAAKDRGTPTVNPPQSQGIDDYSGFKVPHSALRKDWKGLMTVSPDVRSPQDFVRGVKDDMTLPNPRPEAPNQYVASAILWEDGETVLTVEGDSGNVVLTEGIIPSETL